MVFVWKVPTLNKLKCVSGICINDKCIAYGKDMVYNIGCGEFSFN